MVLDRVHLASGVIPLGDDGRVHGWRWGLNPRLPP